MNSTQIKFEMLEIVMQSKKYSQSNADKVENKAKCDNEISVLVFGILFAITNLNQMNMLISKFNFKLITWL